MHIAMLEETRSREMHQSNQTVISLQEDLARARALLEKSEAQRRQLELELERTNRTMRDMQVRMHAFRTKQHCASFCVLSLNCFEMQYCLCQLCLHIVKSNHVFDSLRDDALI